MSPFAVPTGYTRPKPGMSPDILDRIAQQAARMVDAAARYGQPKHAQTWARIEACASAYAMLAREDSGVPAGDQGIH